MLIKDNYFFKNRNSKENIYLITLFCFLSLGILIKSYFHPDGYLSPDSTHYLKLVQNLLNGDGYFVSAHGYGHIGQDKEFFAMWPIGYPTFIFLISKLTGLSPFWASKMLNIICIVIIFFIFKHIFNNKAYVYGFILLFASNIQIFTYSWSETVFITTLIWFTFLVFKLIDEQNNKTVIYFSIFISSIILFLSRYIGAFSFGIIGVLGLYFLLIKKKKYKSIILLGISALNMAIMAIYLYHNYIQTGAHTGITRIASKETNFQIFKQLINTLFEQVTISVYFLSEKTIIILIVQFLVIIYFIYNNYTEIKSKILNKKNNIDKLSATFFSIGLVYLFFIILIRWLTHFDSFQYRVIAPGSILIFIAIINHIETRSSKVFHKLKIFIIFFGFLSYLLTVPYLTWIYISNYPSYNQNLNNLQKIYPIAEENGIFIFAPSHFNYLHPNIQLRRPRSKRFKETWPDFIKRISESNEHDFYLCVPTKNIHKRYDQSVKDFINQYKKGTMVKLR